MALLECSKCGASIHDGESNCTACKEPITTEQPKEEVQDKEEVQGKEEVQNKKEELKGKSRWRGYIITIVWWMVAAVTAAAFFIVWVSVAIEIFNFVQERYW